MIARRGRHTVVIMWPSPTRPHYTLHHIRLSVRLSRVNHYLDKKLSCRRDRATFLVIEYFTKSLKVIRNDTVEWGMCKSLLVLNWNYVCISYRYWDIQRQKSVTLKPGVGVVQGHWKWHRSIDHMRLLLVGHCKHSSILYHFRVIWRWIIVTLKSEGNPNWYYSKDWVQFPIRLP